MSPRKAAVLRHSADEHSLRDHLIAATARMIAAGRTTTLTVRAIAAEAGVADGVLYNHFTDKEELLAAALHAHVRAVERELGALPEPGTGTVEGNLRAHLAYGLAIHHAILPAFTAFVAHPAVLTRFAETNPPDQPWRDQLVGYLRAEQKLGRLAADAPVDAAGAMIVGICHETVLSALFTPAATGTRTLPPDSFITVILDGIASRA